MEIKPAIKVIVLGHNENDPCEGVSRKLSTETTTRPYGYKLTKITYQKEHGIAWKIVMGVAAFCASLFILFSISDAKNVKNLWKKTITGKEIFIIKKEQMGSTKILFDIFKKMKISVDEEQSVQNPSSIENQSCRLLLQISNWLDLKYIPEKIYEDPVFSRYKCAISGKPIRFPCRPNHQIANNTLYEWNTMQQWIKDHPNELPPEWPENLPFKRHNYIFDRKIQKTIEDRFYAYNYAYQCALDNLWRP